MPTQDRDSLLGTLVSIQHRGERLSVDLALRVIREKALSITPHEWFVVMGRLGRAEVHTVSLTLTRFLADFLHGIKARSLADPWFTAGSPTLVAAEEAGLEEVTLMSLRQEDASAAEVLKTRAKLSALVGSLSRGENVASLGHFDVVMSVPPINAPARTITLQFDGGERSVSDHEELLLLPLAARHLNADGYAVFLLTNSFFVREEGARASLADVGLHPSAVLDIPPGGLSGTTVPCSIVVMRKQPSDLVFFGQIQSEFEHNQALIKNLLSRRAGPELSTGGLIPWKDFRGYSHAVYSRRLRKVETQAGVPLVALGDITLSIKRGAKKANASPDPVPANSIYLPKMPTSRVTLAGIEKPAVLETYLVELNPARANASYVAGFLNSDLGREFRTAESSGVTIQRVSLEEARNIRVLLPEPAVQARLVALNERLAAIQNEVSELRVEVWPSPKKIEELEEQVAKINHADRFEDWLESLPHPIASVLWTYHTLAGDEEKRYRQLIHFFEALTEFLATWFLSAYWEDQEARAAVARALQSGRVSLDRASFGTWSTILENLSARTRKVLAENPAETAAGRERQFGTLDTGVLGALCDKSLLSILAEANQLRNLWQGHTGYVPDAEAGRRHLEVIRLLNEVRAVIGKRWARYELFRPGACVTTDSEFLYTVERVVGVRVPFAQKQVTLAHPVKSGDLFFSGETSTRAVKLLPLVKLLPQPKGMESACFFYNRAEGAAERFVSYAYGPEAEVVERYPDVLAVLKGLSVEPASGGSGSAE